MTKNDISALLLELHKETTAGISTPEAMIAAYNKAIDDAIELWRNPESSAADTFNFDLEMEELKIKP